MNHSDANQWKRIAACFMELAELPPHEQQIALAKLRQEDKSLFEAVKQLLEEESSLHPILHTSSPDIWNTESDIQLVGSQIGPYFLADHMGSGGMGSVFLAERRMEDFDQKVALKLIRPGNTGEEAIERFREERQILANLTHPGIARLYDGGTTESGRLYFTMELVDGQDILTFLNTQNAELSTRIQYFLAIVRAIAYAHTRLVLHLDLKPGNILVNEEGEIKVLDFGVARRLDNEVFVFANESAGSKQPYTLAYGAPEQLLGEMLSTRSDIYSLGVLLYQILTDQLPVSPEDDDWMLYRDKVLAGKIHLPSSQSKFPHTIINRNKLEGDLDTIAMKCLERNPEDRYNSVEQLISDLEAYLEDRPISLKRHESAYTFGKFLKRNRTWITTLGIALIGLILLISFYTQQLQSERNEAIKEARKNEALLNFVTDIFQEADPFYARGDTLTVYDLLSQASLRIDTALIDQPDLYTEMVYTLGDIYIGLGEYDLADSMAQKGLQIAVGEPALYQSSTHARLLQLLGSIHHVNGAYQLALQTAEEGLAFSDLLDDDDEVLCQYYELMGILRTEMSENERADSLYRLALNCYRQRAPSDEELIAELTHYLGDVNRKLQQYDSAKIYFERALTLKEKLYEAPHEEIAYTFNHLATLYFEQGGYDTALVYAKDGYRQRRKVFGDAHIETIASMGNLSRIFDEMGLSDSSLAISLEMKDLLEQIFPGPHPYRLGVISHLGFYYARLGRYAESESLYREGVKMFEELAAKNTIGAYDMQGALMYHGLGVAVYEQDRLPEALNHLKEAWKYKSRTEDPSFGLNGRVEAKLGQFLVESGEIEEGREFLLQAKEILSANPKVFEGAIAEIEKWLKVSEGK